MAMAALSSGGPAEVHEPLLPCEEVGVYPPESTEAVEYRLSPWRWAVLVAYITASMSSAIMWIGYSPISDITRQYYGLKSVDTVNWLSLVYMFIYPPGVLFAALLTQALGMRASITFGAFLCALGSWLRFVAMRSFPWAMVGATVAAIGAPFVLNNNARVAAQWFGEKERTLATALASVANMMGVACGFAVSTICTKQIHQEDNLKTLFIVQAALVTGSLVLVILVVRERPSTPPSGSATVPKAHLLSSLRMLVTNVRYYTVFITYTGGIGVLNSLGVLVDQIAAPVGYEPSFSSALGMLAILCGLAGVILWGILVDRFGFYKFALVTCYALAAASMACLNVTVNYLPTSLWYIPAVFCGGVGFFLAPALPITIELGVEYSFPVPEGTSGGLLISAGQLGGFVIAYLAKYLKDSKGRLTYELWLMTAILVMNGIICLFFLSSKYSRKQVEKNMTEG